MFYVQIANRWNKSSLFQFHKCITSKKTNKIFCWEKLSKISTNKYQKYHHTRILHQQCWSKYRCSIADFYNYYINKRCKRRKIKRIDRLELVLIQLKLCSENAECQRKKNNLFDYCNKNIRVPMIFNSTKVHR